MKQNVLFFSVFIFLFLSTLVRNEKNEDFNAQLVDIQYFSICKCSSNSPILVRVIYNTKNQNLHGLKMEHKFSDGISMVVPVTEKDKKGNIVYKFCMDKNKVKNFTTTFVSIDGQRSNRISVTLCATSNNISESTEPRTISVN